jgi:hypothetical protein
MDVQTQVQGKGYSPNQAEQSMSQADMANNQLAALYQKQADWIAEKQGAFLQQNPNMSQDQVGQYMQNLSAYNPFTQQIKTQETRVKDLTMREQGLNPDGSPIAKEFKTILDANGNLPDKYKYNPELLDPSKLEGYSMLKNLATEAGPSKYAQTANLQSELGRQDQIDAATRQSEAAATKARSDLAMRGGASAGSRERLGMNAQDNLMASKQGAYRAQGGQLLDIMKQDELMKRDALREFGTAEGKIAFQNNALTNSAGQYNLGTVLKEEDSRRGYETDTYKAALDKWAANKQAEATRNSGGGGGGK